MMPAMADHRGVASGTDAVSLTTGGPRSELRLGRLDADGSAVDVDDELDLPEPRERRDELLTRCQIAAAIQERLAVIDAQVATPSAHRRGMS